MRTSTEATVRLKAVETGHTSIFAVVNDGHERVSRSSTLVLGTALVVSPVV